MAPTGQTLAHFLHDVHEVDLPHGSSKSVITWESLPRSFKSRVWTPSISSQTLMQRVHSMHRFLSITRKGWVASISSCVHSLSKATWSTPSLSAYDWSSHFLLATQTEQMWVLSERSSCTVFFRYSLRTGESVTTSMPSAIGVEQEAKSLACPLSSTRQSRHAPVLVNPCKKHR